MAYPESVHYSFISATSSTGQGNSARNHLCYQHRAIARSTTASNDVAAVHASEIDISPSRDSYHLSSPGVTLCTRPYTRAWSQIGLSPGAPAGTVGQCGHCVVEAGDLVLLTPVQCLSIHTMQGPPAPTRSLSAQGLFPCASIAIYCLY
eukprot:gene9526-12465_t